ncbi:MAG: LytR C-terminal domain-containing protein [Acidimicrobiales bacterium]
MRRGRVIATSGVLAAALIAVVSYLAASSGGPSKDAAGHSHGSSNVTTTLPAVTSTQPATSTTRPAVSTTTTSPPTSTTTTSATPPSSVVTDPPSDVLVEVLNGVGTPNVALEVARALHRFGFAINGVGNAGAFDHTRNLIEYGPNSFAAAETVAAYVSGVPQYREYSALQANEVWVILGATYNGVTP